MAAPAAIRVLITAGPTHEPIDAVRYLGNRSSGRLGIALATAAAARAMPTTLLLGPTPLQPPDPSLVTTLRFQTTADLERLLQLEWPRHDLLIMAAAVADYRPRIADESSAKGAEASAATNAGTKLRRQAEPLTLELEPTPDLLATCARARRPGQVIIGFALEPAERLRDSARDKLKRKGIDAIVANPLETMESESISATLLLADGRELSPSRELGKPDFARWLLDQLAAVRP